MQCRDACGACCIAPSISSPIPGMPEGKPERPACCSGLQASHDMCGTNREHAMLWLHELEKATAPR